MWPALIIIAVIVLLGLFLVGIYNGMVRARNRSTRRGAASTCSSSAGTT